MTPDRTLFHQLINIEQHYDVLPAAWAVIQGHLDKAREIGQGLQPKLYSSYNPELLSGFLVQNNEVTLTKYNQYLEKRKQDGLNVMFPNKEYAKWFLLQNAPTKFVDGAWLQNIYKVGTYSMGSELDSILHPLYKIYVEELGEGVSDMNHVNIYKQDLAREQMHLCPAQSLSFASDPALCDSAFVAPVIQLALSVFPRRLLPEIIGFNMGYEELPLHLLITTEELKGFSIDPYYFLLHVTIDNAASGHACLARNVALEYLEYIARTHGAEAVHEHWQRMLDGYFLNDINPLKKNLEDERQRHAAGLPAEKLCPRAKVESIIRAKAPWAFQVHGDMKLGQMEINTWLDPVNLDINMDPLMNELAGSSWIVPGRPEDSPFLQDLCQFRGRMFHIFTPDEEAAIAEWIRTLEPEDASNAANERAPAAPRDAALEMADLIKRKSAQGQGRHRRLAMKDKDGLTRSLDEFFADIPGMMQALVHNNMMDGFSKSINVGGRMCSYFAPEDREVVQRWMDAGTPLPSTGATCPFSGATAQEATCPFASVPMSEGSSRPRVDSQGTVLPPSPPQDKKAVQGDDLMKRGKLETHVRSSSPHRVLDAPSRLRLPTFHSQTLRPPPHLLYHYLLNMDDFPGAVAIAHHHAHKQFLDIRANVDPSSVDSFPSCGSDFSSGLLKCLDFPLQVNEVASLFDGWWRAQARPVPAQTEEARRSLGPLLMIDGVLLQNFTLTHMHPLPWCAQLLRIHMHRVGYFDYNRNRRNWYKESLTTVSPCSGVFSSQFPSSSFRLPVLMLSAGLFPSTFTPEILGMAACMMRHLEPHLGLFGESGTPPPTTSEGLDGAGGDIPAWGGDGEEIMRAIVSYLDELGAKEGVDAQLEALTRMKVGHETVCRGILM
eukprot:TRINITY_DN7476_c0_g1_i7.p1 TRINITY_DN7476_c0_g1~~TRINITY_DN7476_c0_g1_i7.p1  ORF type:complete len:888 (+),score=124.32 TRINITY_DN7476_c0_g1_i7:599-3262(+)